MKSSYFSLEYNGSEYLVSFKDQVVAAFGTIQEAFDAKYEFEHRPVIAIEDKMPPATRWAKEHLYRHSA